MFFVVFSATKGRRRLKLSHKTDLDVPDLFLDPYLDQRGETNLKTLICAIFFLIFGVGGLAEPFKFTFNFLKF